MTMDCCSRSLLPMKRPSITSVTIEPVYPFYEISAFNAYCVRKSKDALVAIRRKGRRITRAERAEALNLISDIRTSSVIAVVFAATCLENFIYRYALRRLSHQYYMVHLDRLNLFSKWLVIPRIVTHKELDARSPALNSLRQLISARNDIIHAKASVRIGPTRKEAKQFMDRSLDAMDEVERSAERAPKVVEDAVNFIRTVDRSRTVKALIRETLAN